MTAAAGRSPNWSTFGGAAVALGALVVAFVLGADSWFYADDWNSFDKYADGSLLAPFNGHLSVVPAAVMSLLYRTVGVGSYVPFRIVALAVLAVLAVVVWRYSSRRVGSPAGWLIAAMLLWNASAASNLQFPFLINFSIPLIATICMWDALDRRTRGGNIAASLSLAVALASSGLGLMALAAAVVELALRRAPWRVWATMAPGPALWGIWYLANGESTPLVDSADVVVRYSLGMVTGALQALGGGSVVGAVLATLVVSGFLLLSVRSRHSSGSGGAPEGPEISQASEATETSDAPQWPRFAAGMTAAVTFVVSTSLTRAETIPAIPPGELRYAWTISVYLVLAVVGLFPLLDGSASSAIAWLQRSTLRVVPVAMIAVTVVLSVIGAIVSVDRQRDWVAMTADAAPGLRANLYAAEAVGAERADPAWVMPLSFEPVTADAYLAAVAAVGSPLAGASVEEFGGDDLQRITADRMLVEQLPIGLDPAQECVPVGPSARELGEVPPGSVVRITNDTDDASPAEVRVARFARDSDAVVAATVPPGLHLLRIPSDASSMPVEIPYRVIGDDALSLQQCSR